jgi:hypothetical protein
MDLLDHCAEEAIAVKEQSIEEQERAEAECLDLDGPSEGLGVLLLLSTWSAFEGHPFEYWEELPPLPSVSADTGEALQGSS